MHILDKLTTTPMAKADAPMATANADAPECDADADWPPWSDVLPPEYQ